MTKVYKLSVGGLKKLIAEEKARINKTLTKESFGSVKDVEKEAKKTKEVDAEDLADTLEKPLDQLKVQKIKEAKLLASLKQCRLEQGRIKKRIQETKRG